MKRFCSRWPDAVGQRNARMMFTVKIILFSAKIAFFIRGFDAWFHAEFPQERTASYTCILRHAERHGLRIDFALSDPSNFDQAFPTVTVVICEFNCRDHLQGYQFIPIVGLSILPSSSLLSFCPSPSPCPCPSHSPPSPLCPPPSPPPLPLPLRLCEIIVVGLLAETVYSSYG